MIKIIADGISMDLPHDLNIQLSIENPLFQIDRIPVACTTNIEFPPTQKNLTVFGFQDKLFLKPEREKVPATLMLNELRIMDGTLCFDIYEDRVLKASFVGVELDNILDKDLSLLNLEEWVFEGPPGTVSTTHAERERYGSLLASAARGEQVFACAPIRKTNARDTRITGQNMGFPMFLNCFQGSFLLYANDVLSGYYCPAIRLSYLIPKILSDKIVVDGFDMDDMHDIVLITTSKPKGVANNYYLGGLEPRTPTEYVFSLSSPMPEVLAGDLLKNILKMFGASVYPKGSNYVIRANNHVIRDKNFEDWSDKISDTYSIYIEKAKTYKYGYAKGIKNDTPEDTPIIVPDILTMLNYGNFAENTYFEIATTKEVYHRDGYREVDDKGKITMEDYQYKLIRQGDFFTETEDDRESFD